MFTRNYGLRGVISCGDAPPVAREVQVVVLIAALVLETGHEG